MRQQMHQVIREHSVVDEATSPVLESRARGLVVYLVCCSAADKLDALTLHRQRAGDRFACRELGRDKGVGIQINIDRHRDFGGPVVDGCWRDRNRRAVQPQGIKDFLGFVPRRSRGRAWNDRSATAFVNRVVDRVPDHRDTTKLECRKEKEEQ